MKRTYLLAGAMALALSACSGGEADEPAAAAEEVAAIPESLAPFGDGYPTAGAPCRQLGESAATSNYLDDSALLIGCPSDETAAMLGGKVVGNVEGVRLVSVPMGDANTGMPEGPPMQSPVEQTAAAKPREVAIRGANGLEGRCAKRVASETGARVIGTNRIEESEAAIGIYVNVEGAEAPWRCLAYRDGTIGEVMYTGSEGAL
ncbi:hypothetical protein G6N82_12265 [Altererythrobacter sp. BO-6]|uniref:hypothetical protein n=1 Tax=Altererythrobacter sp. BO-6 TaxID=2604537 RepID=UPI0013E1D987|nr:hypothetical protein [Altererythrobacter sp. BO-6]QIG54824.1 hypothetical protein G6N82_12265 [Altererythrobacter sp. BO-6]